MTVNHHQHYQFAGEHYNRSFHIRANIDRENNYLDPVHVRVKNILYRHFVRPIGSSLRHKTAITKINYVWFKILNCLFTIQIRLHPN